MWLPCPPLVCSVRRPPCRSTPPRDLEAVDASPQPEGEWQPLAHPSATIFLSALVQASVSALRRYASRERSHPDEVAWRLHVVARLWAIEVPGDEPVAEPALAPNVLGGRARHLPHLPGGSPSTSRPRRRLLRSLREGLAASSSAAASSGPTTATAASSSSSDGGRPVGGAGRKRRPAGGRLLSLVRPLA